MPINKSTIGWPLDALFLFVHFHHSVFQVFGFILEISLVRCTIELFDEQGEKKIMKGKVTITTSIALLAIFAISSSSNNRKCAEKA